MEYSKVGATFALNIVHPKLLYTSIDLATLRMIWRLILSFKVNDKPCMASTPSLGCLMICKRENGQLGVKFMASALDAQVNHTSGIVT